MNFASRLLAGKQSSRSVALETLQGRHTYAELCAAAAGTRARLRRQGARQGDRVAILAENGLFWVASYLGAIGAGCVAVPISSALSREQVASVLSSGQVRHAFCDPRAARAHASALAAASVAVEGEALPEDPAPEAEVDEARDLAALLFTSGSTSRPRGVMLSHRNLLANTASILSALGIGPDDRAMTVLPFSYTFGASVLHTHLAQGATLVLDPRFMFPDKVLLRMAETRCTGFAGVPSHFQILLRKSRLRTVPLPDLRWVQQAGGKLASEFIVELREALPQARIFIMYGATEATARITCLPPGRLAEKLGSAGRAIPGVTVRVVDAEGKALPAGQTGEVEVEGDNVAAGYLDDPAESAATFRGGRLRTGDLGYLDEEGFLYIVDRAKDFLKCGGTRVSCKEVEEALLRFGDLVEVAVAPMPDELLGEAVAAFVVPRAPGDERLEERLRAFAAQALAPALQPKRIWVLPELPKSEAGKVQRPALRRLIAKGG